MKNRRSLIMILSAVILTILFTQEGATDPGDDVTLPSPKIRGQFMKALNNRISIKGFSREPLSDKTISGLLWSAFGVVDRRTGRRTAPSAFNVQEIDIYLLFENGAFRYNAHANILKSVCTEDVRELVAGQAYSRRAPLQLVYVADLEKAHDIYPDAYENEIEAWAMLHTGFIAQNVTTFCAVKRLCAVVRSFGNREMLREKLKLGDGQKILITQAVGHRPR